MVAAAIPLLAMLLVGTPARGGQPSKLEQGQKLFKDGQFDDALKALDAAAAEGGDAATLEKVHLLRAQCFAVRQDFARAEDAFAQALEANPDAALDPAKVDPTLVKLLEAVRARSTGSVRFESTPPGATVVVDGAELGATPRTVSLPVGRHKLEARWPEASSPSKVLEVQVRPRKDLRVEWVQKETAGPSPVDIEPRPLRPFGDLRGLFEPGTNGSVGGGLQIGGGVEYSYFRLGLWVRLLTNFDLTPRFQFSLPVVATGAGELHVTLEVGVPFSFYTSGFAVGVQAAGGAELYLLKWLAPYVLVGGAHHFFRAGYDTEFLLTGGLRLRVP